MVRCLAFKLRRQDLSGDKDRNRTLVWTGHCGHMAVHATLICSTLAWIDYYCIGKSTISTGVSINHPSATNSPTVDGLQEQLYSSACLSQNEPLGLILVDIFDHSLRLCSMSFSIPISSSAPTTNNIKTTTPWWPDYIWTVMHWGEWLLNRWDSEKRGCNWIPRMQWKVPLQQEDIKNHVSEQVGTRGCSDNCRIDGLLELENIISYSKKEELAGRTCSICHHCHSQTWKKLTY